MCVVNLHTTSIILHKLDETLKFQIGQCSVQVGDGRSRFKVCPLPKLADLRVDSPFVEVYSACSRSAISLLRRSTGSKYVLRIAAILTI